MRIVLFLMAFLFVGCTIDVEYTVTGTAKNASVSYYDADGSLCQKSSVQLPFSEKITANVGDYVGVTAQNGTSQGIITVTVKKEGDSFKTGTSEGAFCVSSAGGVL